MFKPKKHLTKKLIIAVAILLLISVSFYTGILFSKKTEIDERIVERDYVYLGTVLNKYEAAIKENLSKDVDFNIFWDVWKTLEDKYVDADELQEKEMFYGAVRGMVNAIGDPYTVFMNPAVSKEFSDDLKGEFEGIGAEISIKGGILTIIAPLTDMPAQKAGLRSGDKVLAIDREDTTGIYIDEAVRKIRGPKGTEVVLTIWREGFEEPKDFTITRGKIIVKSVKWEMDKNNIMVIKISHFNEDTKGLFDRAVRDVIKKNPQAIILDLRNNPGGYLETAIEIASEWVEDGAVVTEKFSEEKKNEYLARGRARLDGYKTVVLVNQGSASASEIVAGALKDYEKATVIGMQTFGKGSVQALEELEDGSSVKITVAYWLTPNGININKEGITPDEEIELTPEDWENDVDPQMEKGIEILLNSTE